MLNIYQKNLNFGETNKNEMHLSLQRMENRSKRPPRGFAHFLGRFTGPRGHICPLSTVWLKRPGGHQSPLSKILF